MAIEIKDNESIDKALKRFKIDTQRADIVGEFRKRENAVGKQEKKRLKSERARKKKSKKGGSGKY